MFYRLADVRIIVGFLSCAICNLSVICHIIGLIFVQLAGISILAVIVCTTHEIPKKPC